MLEASGHPITNVNTQTAGFVALIGLLAACTQEVPPPVASRPKAPIVQAAKPTPPSEMALVPKAVPPAPEPAAPKAPPARRKAEPAPVPKPVASASSPQPMASAPARQPAAIAPDGRSREQLALLPPAGFVEPARIEAPLPVAPPALTTAPIRVVNRIEPDFPRAAFQARVDRGLVKARMTLDGRGNVMRVDIVEAKPTRVFDSAVSLALAQWKFNDGAPGRTYDTEVVFQR
jgi:TonB family protein